MVTVIKKGSSKDLIKELLEKLIVQRKVRGLDAQKFCGIITLEENPLEIQKALRDEWK